MTLRRAERWCGFYHTTFVIALEEVSVSMNKLKQRLVTLKQKAADLNAQVDELLRLRERIRQAKSGPGWGIKKAYLIGGMVNSGLTMSQTVH